MMPPPHSQHERAFIDSVHMRKLLKRPPGAMDSPGDIDDSMDRREVRRPHPSNIPSPYNADLPYATGTRGQPASTSRDNGVSDERMAAARLFERSYRGEFVASDEDKDV
jgi:hypothetical protein